MNIFELQDIFTKKMLDDHRNGMLVDGMLEPYFAWKSGSNPLPTLNEAMDIVNVAVGMLDEFYDRYPNAVGEQGDNENDPWNDYVGYGKDKYIVSYLEAIDGEVSNWIISGILRNKSE